MTQNCKKQFREFDDKSSQRHFSFFVHQIDWLTSLIFQYLCEWGRCQHCQISLCFVEPAKKQSYPMVVVVVAVPHSWQYCSAAVCNLPSQNCFPIILFTYSNHCIELRLAARARAQFLYILSTAKTVLFFSRFVFVLKSFSLVHTQAWFCFCRVAPLPGKFWNAIWQYSHWGAAMVLSDAVAGYMVSVGLTQFKSNIQFSKIKILKMEWNCNGTWCFYFLGFRMFIGMCWGWITN